MNYRIFDNKIVIRIDKGEEIISCLKTICQKIDIKLGSIFGIGSTDKFTIGFFNTKTKKYQSKEFTTDHEITSLLGNISIMNNEVYLHLHVTLCNSEYKAIGGHLTSAVISATFEGIIDLIDGQIIREHDHILGLNKLKF